MVLILTAVQIKQTHMINLKLSVQIWSFSNKFMLMNNNTHILGEYRNLK